tara:strand:- start:4536 stop:5642 length:1107 start_codon:yes stop_codon:yes gene_type:complete
VKKKIFICCTEQSGENICFNIIKRLKKYTFEIDGVCGFNSEKYINNKFFDISEFKSIGLIEIIFSIRKYIKMINFLKNKIIENNYDLIICIDSPDFNYNLVKSLRKKNYSNKIIHIVAPTVWAWRKNRAKKFANIFDEIFLLFDFEKKYFNFPNIISTVIGHPIFHISKRKKNINYKYISFLFGSRVNEVNKLFPYFDAIEKYISLNKLEWSIFIPTLPHLTKTIEEKTRIWTTNTIISDKIDMFDRYYENVFISITCSGTATLEIAKRNIPQIIIYKLNFITELILKMFVKIRMVSILNIVSNKIIIPEIINSKLNKNDLINMFIKITTDNNFREEQIKNVNLYLPHIETNKSPYDISVKRIIDIIN